jgi:hypothetical protein
MYGDEYTYGLGYHNNYGRFDTQTWDALKCGADQQIFYNKINSATTDVYIQLHSSIS